MANMNGTWFVRLVMTLAVAGILGGVGVYAQVRDNTSDMKDAKEVHKVIQQDLKEISGNQAEMREAAARTETKVEAIYDVIVKGE